MVNTNASRRINEPLKSYVKVLQTANYKNYDLIIDYYNYYNRPSTSSLRRGLRSAMARTWLDKGFLVSAGLSKQQGVKFRRALGLQSRHGSGQSCHRGSAAFYTRTNDVLLVAFSNHYLYMV